MTIMTLQPMAYDLRCAMMMFASVDCSLRLIYMDRKRPEKWIEIKCDIEIIVATINLVTADPQPNEAIPTTLYLCSMTILTR